MTPSNVARWLLLPVLAFAAAWSNVTPAIAAGCEDNNAYQQAVEPGPRTGPGLSVRVAIHIMEPQGQKCEVRKVWTPKHVATIFGGGTQDQHSVNSIWGSTRIRFFVHELVIDETDPPAGMVDDSQHRIIVPIPGPLGSVKYEKAFDRLVAGNRHDHKIHVYIWRLLSGEPVGFGRSTRSGKGTATVFLDNKCSEDSLGVCATFAAHELGHALGLYHASQACGAVDPLFRGLCTRLAKPCAGVKHNDRLMTPGALGKKLCPLEVVKAELMAVNQFQ